jgi:putative hydrolase of the HAD superfamily
LISRNPNRYRAVILDYGLVLCESPSIDQVTQIAQRFNLNPQSFWKLYEKNRGAYDRGDLSSEEYWSLFAQDTQVVLSKDDFQAIQALDIGLWSSLNSEMFDWVSRLRENGYRTAILSNMHHEFARRLRAVADWLNKFDHLTFSCEVRLIKPDPAIFDRCLNGLDVTPAEALFIDDRPINVRAAERTGITGITYQSIGQLQNRLLELQFEVLPTCSEFSRS